MRRAAFALTCVLLISCAQPLLAQGCGTIFWASQGNQEKYYSHGEEVVYRAGGGGIFRVYYRSRSQSPYTLITRIGHPWDFGLKGSKPAETRSVVRMKPQNQQQINNGKMNVQLGQPGVTWIGYEIVGAYRPGVFEQIPPRCRSQTVQVRVMQRGGGDYSFSEPRDFEPTLGPSLLFHSPMNALKAWLRDDEIP